MQNSQTIKCMKLLDALFAICYLMNDTVNLTLLIFYGLEYTRKYGVSIYSPRLVAMVCVFFSGPLNDLQGAALYANFSLRLFQKVNHRPSVASTILTAYAFGLCWTNPMGDVIVKFKTAFITGTETGDVENATWCIFQYLVGKCQAGSNLVVLEAEFTHHLQKMEDCNRKTQAFLTKAWSKVVQSLIGLSHDNLSLGMDDVPGDSQTALAKLFDDSAQRVGLLYMGEFEKCAHLAWQENDSWQKASAGHMASCPDVLASALSYVASAQHGTAKFRYRRHALRKRATIDRWIKQGNPNIQHWKPFLDAEYSSLKSARKHSGVVVMNYRSAVELAQEGGTFTTPHWPTNAGDNMFSTSLMTREKRRCG